MATEEREAGQGPAGQPASAPAAEARPAGVPPAPQPRAAAGVYVAGAAVLLVLAFLIALVATNTRKVKVSWVFGDSEVSLIALVLATAFLGWILGVATALELRRRSRRRQEARAGRR